MQSRFVDLLVGEEKNLMVVGDDDQSIYGWRGATLANILDFTVHYPSAKDITLIENYRSTQPILDAAYRLIRHNDPHRLEVMNQLDKRLRAQAKTGPEPKVQHFSNLDSELEWLVQDIGDRLRAGQSPASIAVLTRRTALVLRVHEALEQAGISHAVAGISNDLYEQNSVRQLLEALTTIADPLNDMALFHTLSGPVGGVDVIALSRLAASANREHQALSAAIMESGDAETKAALMTIEKWRSAAATQTVGSLAYDVISDSGWKAKLYDEAKGSSTVLTEVQALSAFFKTLKEFERIAGVASVQNYVANLPTLRSAETSFEDVSLQISDTTLNVLSVHRAKGLEWDTVYIVDCSEGSFPLKKRSSGLELPAELRSNSSAADEHLSEERRLMYVAVTRARKELLLSHADKHGGGATRKPSRFLNEMFGENTPPSTVESVQETQLEQFAPLKADALIAALPPAMLDDNGHLTLNVSQIATWLDCPEDFHYKYVLNMPLPPAPQLAYGTLIHSAIERINRGRLEGHVPSFEELRNFVVGGLPQTGYASKRSRERAHAQAEHTIKQVYERFVAEALPSALETPFRVSLADIGLTITGRIDAVYPLGDAVEIRDYKTGTSVTTAEKAKSRATGSQQLTLYALAWRQLHDEMPALLSLDFVETGLIGSVKKQAKSLATLEQKLAEMVASIRSGQYPAASRHDNCAHP
jgi:DNA helicase-2/ATP-dependent DNA helicase PcrA